MVAAATITILVTRLYLFLTGYPQIGGEIFHIAHSVWGGLLLMIGLAIALAVANYWSPIVAGILGGVGAGLFIDEIGKFITKDNDYFFPLAAPLAYGVLVIFGAVAYLMGRVTRDTARAHLYAALDLVKPTLDGPITQRQLDLARSHVRSARELADDDRSAALIDGLDRTLDTASETVTDDPSHFGAALHRLRSWEQRALPEDRVRKICRGALVVLTVIGLIAGPGVLGWSLWQLFGPESLRGNSLLGQQPGAVAWTAAAVAALAGLVAGCCAARAVQLLGPDSDNLRDGVRWGLVALAVLLVGGNFLSSYFDQFFVLLEGSAQAGVFGALVRYGRRIGVLRT